MKINASKYIVFIIITLLFWKCDKQSTTPDSPTPPPKPSTEIRKGNYYVATDGNDKNNGTAEHPFKTIKKGVSVLLAGDTLIVKNGNYNEFINIEKGGKNETSKIYILSEKILGAKCMGFRVFKNADYVTINGFKITSEKPDYSGVVVYGKTHIEISDCHIYECPVGGIRFFKNAKYPKIINNTFEHNGFFGIYLDGSNALIKNNTISKTVQYHPNCNPEEHKGADADGIVIFGVSHKIIANKIIDIGDPKDSGNKNPHSDCIQTSRITGNTVLQNAIISNNYFRVNHNSGKGIIMESYNTNCHDVLIYNNIFEIKDIGVAAYNGNYQNIKIWNNVFKTNLEQKSWGTAVYLKNIENYEFINNITIDCKREHRKIVGGSGIVAYNLAYNSDNSNFSMTPKKQDTEIVGKNPNFVKYTGKHGENDFHLQKNSPAIDKGKTISYIKTDKDETKRPQGKAYDIGAYEFK